MFAEERGLFSAQTHVKSRTDVCETTDVNHHPTGPGPTEALSSISAPALRTVRRSALGLLLSRALSSERVRSDLARMGTHRLFADALQNGRRQVFHVKDHADLGGGRKLERFHVSPFQPNGCFGNPRKPRRSACVVDFAENRK